MPVETVGIVVATFGDQRWHDLAVARALPSARAQTSAAAVLHVHGRSLHEARNDGITQIGTDWVVCLDADDELDLRYVEAMLLGDGDVRQPATVAIDDDGTQIGQPNVISPRPLIEGNFIVIGAMVRRPLLLSIGGFRNFPVLEDWDLWIRCWLAGAVFGACPDAIYRIHLGKGRNQAPVPVFRDTYRRIRHEHLPAARLKATA